MSSEHVTNRESVALWTVLFAFGVLAPGLGMYFGRVGFLIGFVVAAILYLWLSREPRSRCNLPKRPTTNGRNPRGFRPFFFFCKTKN